MSSPSALMPQSDLSALEDGACTEDRLILRNLHQVREAASKLERVGFGRRQLIVEFAAKSGLPTMFGSPESVEPGGLMSYGVRFAELFTRAATFVDRLLNGAQPRTLMRVLLPRPAWRYGYYFAIGRMQFSSA